MSWLFVLLAQLKQFIVPLVALVVFGQRGDRNELWTLIPVGALVLLAVWQFLTYRYRIDGDRLVVRSGLLERSLRVIPFARIHNVAVQQSLLHRVFGVAEVRLESAGGTRPEAEMRVLRLDDALALEALVRRRGAATAAAGPAAGAAVDGEGDAQTLLHLPLGEVLRLGVVSNRGMLVVGAAFAAVSQFSPKLLTTLMQSVGKGVFGYAGSHLSGPVDYALGAIVFVAACVLVLRLFSIAIALLQYHGFRLSEHGRRLTVERGLLARWRTSASRRRIQAWTLREGVLHRWLKRRSLEVDIAVAVETQHSQRALRELAPIATPDACDALVAHLLPRARFDALDWQPLPRGSWLRLFWPGALVTLAVTAVASARFGPWGLLVLAWLPWAALAAVRNARRAGYAVDGTLVAVREGWWSRRWRFAEIDKLQALHLSRSPIDRRCGTASLWLDTAGAGPMAPPLRLRFIPEADAIALQDRLSAVLATRPLRW
ncbi:PH domain-containing protein [Cognatilysobacter tabacisoli]|uniref:PH domain-containing protein n=1 Tax=Cognatilysobacter tabacisoli TaxID=2315424 RepID=UPI001E374463|nr:PH domain-containing protein [Lysobacter tabacisoli]